MCAEVRPADDACAVAVGGVALYPSFDDAASRRRLQACARAHLPSPSPSATLPTSASRRRAHRAARRAIAAGGGARARGRRSEHRRLADGRNAAHGRRRLEADRDDRGDRRGAAARVRRWSVDAYVCRARRRPGLAVCAAAAAARAASPTPPPPSASPTPPQPTPPPPARPPRHRRRRRASSTRRPPSALSTRAGGLTLSGGADSSPSCFWVLAGVDWFEFILIAIGIAATALVVGAAICFRREKTVEYPRRMPSTARRTRIRTRLSRTTLRAIS